MQYTLLKCYGWASLLEIKPPFEIWLHNPSPGVPGAAQPDAGVLPTQTLFHMPAHSRLRRLEAAAYSARRICPAESTPPLERLIWAKACGRTTSATPVPGSSANFAIFHFPGIDHHRCRRPVCTISSACPMFQFWRPTLVSGGKKGPTIPNGDARTCPVTRATCFCRHLHGNSS